MRQLSTYVMPILLATIGVIQPPPPTIAFDRGEPSSKQQSEIHASGKFKLAAGQTLSGITLIASPGEGGAGGEVSCTVIENAGTWDGTILHLDSGAEYQVFARAEIQDATGNTIQLDTKSIELKCK